MSYAFRPGPEYAGATGAELWASAMSQPMSLGATFWDQAKGGMLESFGLGTAIRDFAIPEGNVDRSGIGITDITGLINPLERLYPLARDAIQSQNPELPSMTEEQYKSSAYFRTGIPWDGAMTEDRAASLASWDDAKKVREYYAEKRPLASFIGNLAGQAVDPINYVPVAGPVVKAAAVARAGKIGGAAIASALDAAANTAVFGIGTAGRRGAYGDDVSWQATVSQIATAALIGGAFGTVGGALGARADRKALDALRKSQGDLATLKTTQEARVALNEAIDGLVRGGDVSLSPNATAPLQREAEKLTRAYDDVSARPDSRTADDALASVGYDLKALANRGDDVDAIMRSASVEEAARAVQVQEIASINERLATMLEEKPVPNLYGPGLLHTEKAPATDEVYDTGMGGAVPIAERQAEIAALQDRLTGLEAKQAAGDVADEFIGAIKFGRGAPVSRSIPSGVSTTPKDTAEGLSAGLPGATKRPTRNIAQAVDNSKANPEPAPEGRTQAETAVGKPDDYRAMAAQYRVDPETGSYFEEPEIKQIEAEGRLTDDDRAALDEAQATYENGDAYGEAMKAAVSCLI